MIIKQLKTRGYGSFANAVRAVDKVVETLPALGDVRTLIVTCEHGRFYPVLLPLASQQQFCVSSGSAHGFYITA